MVNWIGGIFGISRGGGDLKARGRLCHRVGGEIGLGRGLGIKIRGGGDLEE